MSPKGPINPKMAQRTKMRSETANVIKIFQNDHKALSSPKMFERAKMAQKDKNKVAINGSKFRPLNISVKFMLASFFWDALFQVPVWYQRLKLVAGEPRVRGQGGGGGGVGGQRGGASTA